MEFKLNGSKTELYQKLKDKLSGYIAGGKMPFIKESQWNDQTCSANLIGAGFKAAIKCNDNLAHIDLELGLALKMMKSQIEAQIKKTVEKIFQD